MKKSSKMPKRMRETIGIDLGDKVSRYCMVDQEGEVMEEGTFRNQASSLEKHFGDRPRRIALEAGAQSAWISRELKRLGHEVIVANPRELKWITSSDTKNDPVDARKLALLARADVRLLTPVEHRSAEQQAELAVIRGRDAILRARTLLINSARSIAKGFGVRLPKSITHTFGERAVDALPEFLRSALTGLLAQIDAISRANRRLRSADRRVGREASGTGAARKYSRRRPAHRDDVRAHAGPRRAICTQPRCRGVPGAAAEAATERRARPAVGDFQERRSLFAQVAGAVRPPYFGSLRQRLGAPAMGPGQERGRQESDPPSDRRGGPEAIRTAAPLMGERRLL
jgi:transposase